MSDKRCECDETGSVSPFMVGMYAPEERAGMNHAPGECLGTYDLALYRRDGRTLWLCSCCCMIGDVRLNETSRAEIPALPKGRP